MNGLFIYFDFNREEETGNPIGIIKKIRSQHKCFRRNLGGDCDLVNLRRAFGQNSPLLFFSFLLSDKTFDISPIDGKRYDYVYVRRIDPNCRSVVYILRQLRKWNPECKIVYEVPTYPYDLIYRKSLLGNVKLRIDRHYRAQLHRHVDRIATLTPDGELFGCRTLRITNGVDCGSIEVSKKESYDRDRLSLVAVAQFGFYHGYERVIEGLANYKEREIVLHLVGDGGELKKYKALVGKHGLGGQVRFHGPLSGDDLTEVFDTADIALCPLACHRVKIFLSSALKSREYLCRGLPIVTSTPIDIIPDGFEYCLRVPEDESPVDIRKVAEFADAVYGGGRPRSGVAAEIRSFAERTCGMDTSMRSVLEFFKEGSGDESGS